MYFISVLFLENIEVCAKAHGQIWSGRPPRLWLGGSAPKASDQRWRRPRVHPLPALSALPVPYRELQSLENVFLKVIPESTRKEVTQIQRTRILVIESKNSQGKICVSEVENCFAMGVRRY